MSWAEHGQETHAAASIAWALIAGTCIEKKRESIIYISSLHVPFVTLRPRVVFSNITVADQGCRDKLGSCAVAFVIMHVFSQGFQ